MFYSQFTIHSFKNTPDFKTGPFQYTLFTLAAENVAEMVSETGHLNAALTTKFCMTIT